MHFLGHALRTKVGHVLIRVIREVPTHPHKAFLLWE